MFRNLPREIIYNHIIKRYPLDFICVDKTCESYVTKIPLKYLQIDVNKVFKYNNEIFTPIGFAITHGYIHLVKRLLKTENIHLSRYWISRSKYGPLMPTDLVEHAIRNNQRQIAQMILDDPRYVPSLLINKIELQSKINKMI